MFSGFFFDLDYSSTKEFLIILLISLIFLISASMIFRISKWIDIIISIIIFLICAKVFLLSSFKDPFHYSWYLGPINSIGSDYNLLDNVVSQYGYLNILLISKISSIINFDSSTVLVFFIVILFFIFFIYFYLKF